MPAHTWVTGEAITASKLNNIEKKKAFISGTLNPETMTWAEMVSLMEETGLPQCYYVTDNGHYYLGYASYSNFLRINCEAESQNALLVVTGVSPLITLNYEER